MKADDGGSDEDEPDPSSVRPPCMPSVLRPRHAKLDTLLVFRSIHPLYGAFLLDHLGVADPVERLQALESVLELPRPMLKFVRLPWPDELPPGPLATELLGSELVQRGLIAAPEPPAEATTRKRTTTAWPERPPSLGREAVPALRSARTRTRPTCRCSRCGRRTRCCATTPATSTSTSKPRPDQAGGAGLPPLAAADPAVRRVRHGDAGGRRSRRMAGVPARHAERLTESCRAIDPTSTDEAIEHAHDADVVEGEAAVPEHLQVSESASMTKSRPVLVVTRPAASA